MYSVGSVAQMIGAVVHVLFIIFFAFLRVPLMVCYNFISVAIFLAALILIVRREKYSLACSLGVIEFAIHQSLAIVSVMASVILQLFNTVMTFFVALVMSYLFIHYVKQAEDKADREFERAEALLHNILPASIAERLKADSSAIADGFDSVSALFADIVDFTVMSERLEPAQVVSLLNDLWGDAVNTASRMESHGLPGMIQVTRDSYELLKDEYEFEDRGWIEVKGKGSIETFLLLGRKAAA
jgi:hypothetical protein